MLTPLVLYITTALLGALCWMLFMQKKKAGAELQRTLDKFKSIIDAEAERERILRDTDAERAKIIGDAMATGLAIVSDASTKNAALDGEVKEKSASIADMSQEKAALAESIAVLKKELDALDEIANLQSFGFYKPNYSFADADHYNQELDRILVAQKDMLSAKSAAICSIEWTVNGSKVEGKKQTNQTLKMILRAFNGEADACISKVKYNNIQVMETRIRKAREAINKLVEIQGCAITTEYLDLKLKELYLVHEYQEKLQQEKDEQRRIREQMREEERAQREIEQARLVAEQEEARYQDALTKARHEIEQATGEKQLKLQQKIKELEENLAVAQQSKERAISRAQMTRSGHVYIISNIGSFGEDVFKIGMTRRLEPLERIYELSDASVPFEFDVHAMVFSEDAPSLEHKLHQELERHRINLVNDRKEFFSASIDNIAEVVRKHHGEITLTQLAEAKEFRTSQAMKQAGQSGIEDPRFHGGTNVQP